MKKNIKKNYVKSCNEYLRAFCDKHDFYYEDDAWVAGVVGGIACVGGYFVGMETIQTDIDMDIPEREFIKYIDYSMRAGILGAPIVTFTNWLKGETDKMEEDLTKIERLRAKVIAFEHELHGNIESIIKNKES
jgi:hypothetical protein